MDPKTNKERLLRGIRCMQLIQRTNPPNSGIVKAATKALAPLLDELAKFPVEQALTEDPPGGAS